MPEKLPNLVTTLPGPRARSWIQRDVNRVSPSYTRVYPLVVERGEGAGILDVDGNWFLDFTAGIAVTSTGHSHPEVVRAISEQASKLIHMSGTDFYYEPQIRLAEEIAAVVPLEGPVKVFFGNSGAEANEAAVKLARYHTGRPRILAFFGSFHGRTMGALSLTSSRSVQKRGFFPLVPGVEHVPYAYCYRCPVNRQVETCDVECFSLATDYLFPRTVPPEEVAAIVVEVVQGEGGYVVPPPKFLERIQSVAKEHGILIIADEVQSGMGRTGRMFASEHFDFHPDMITIAKGVASGLPLGLCVARESIMRWVPGSHASTFGGNPVACAAALTTLRLLKDQYLENARVQGERLQAGVRAVMARHRIVGDVRGLGLMVGAEIIVPGTSDRKRDPRRRDAIVEKAFHRGLLLLGCGDNTVRFCPPLVVTSDEVDTCLGIFEEAVAEAEAEA
ncbi:MAG TPA: acetyl ornithine aminotransferase family protein [Candidatus Polarisedimenticolia bacterium]|nr:acetyl ornithine aminotransferase family protein [Candidatus Polarisedimenticolia bacterium]